MTDRELRAEVRLIVAGRWGVHDVDSMTNELMAAFARFERGENGAMGDSEPEWVVGPSSPETAIDRVTAAIIALTAALTPASPPPAPTEPSWPVFTLPA